MLAAALRDLSATPLCVVLATRSEPDELEWQGWLEADGRGFGFVANLTRRVIARDMITPGQLARLLARDGAPRAS